MGIRGSRSDSNSEPKPTIYKWLKENKIKDYPKDCPVEIVWLPKNWPNFTIDTKLFRVRIHEDSPIFKPFDEMLLSFIQEGIPMQVSILNDNGEWDIDRIPDKQCKWEKLSSTGYKMGKIEKLWKPSNKTPSK